MALFKFAILPHFCSFLRCVAPGLHDEIFQGTQPVLAGVDAKSTYYYLLKGVEHRDKETWGWHLLDAGV
jgi:hypothetical protein